MRSTRSSSKTSGLNGGSVTASATASGTGSRTTAINGKKRSTGKRKAKGAVAVAAVDSGAGEQTVAAKSVLIKGGAAVDSEFPLAAQTHVLCENDGADVWDCMLNQTCVQNNNNKFYLLQVLRHDVDGSYHVWMRWGRVGFSGQRAHTPCGSNLSQAKAMFTKKFQDKTKNEWSERRDFEKYPGKYDMLKMDYSVDEPDSKKPKKDVKPVEAKEPPPCTLSESVERLVRLICDVQLMQQTVMEMQYDANKAPLGKLTEGQIRAGYEALQRIDTLIRTEAESAAAASSRQLLQACDDFYTRVPHSFGMRRPPLIRTAEDVKLKMQLLETLGDIQLALKRIDEENSNQDSCCLNPVDRHYRSLRCSIEPVASNTDLYQLLCRCVATTHGPTHSGYRLRVLNVFALHKPSEDQRFLQHYGNPMLLWHGSRLTNWAGILGAGLKIAPPEAPSTGYMFGKGIYFADMVTKSANYCWHNASTKSEGLLALSEVALGQCNELNAADYRADKLPKGKHSVKGLGRNVPNANNCVTMEDGVVVPMGPSVHSSNKQTHLLYNEYIVYNVAQVRMRYLVRVKFESR